MPRGLYAPFADLGKISKTIGIPKGGTTATTGDAAVDNIGGLKRSTIGKMGGLATLDAQQYLPVEELPSGSAYLPSLVGPVSLYTNQVGTYLINNFDSATVYTLSSSAGTVSRSDDTITFTAPATAGAVTITLNDKVISVNVVLAVPVVTGPSALSAGQTGTYTITNYDAAATYTLSATLGTATISGATITYVAGSTVGTGVITVNAVNTNVAISLAVPTISGPTTLKQGDVGTFTITNYVAGLVYNVTSTLGTFTRSGATITYTAGQVLGTGTVVVNGVTDSFSVVAATVDPIISGPSSVAQNSTNTYTITNYDSGTTYTLSSYLGTATRSGDTITYVTGSTSGTGSITVNNVTKSISIAEPAPNVTGSWSVYTNSVNTYTITNYSSLSSVTVAASVGTVSRSGSTITYTAPSTAGTGGFTVNGYSCPVTVTVEVQHVNEPTITNPAYGSVGTSTSITVTTSAFSATAPDTHVSSDWMVTSDSSGRTILKSSTADTTNKVSWTVTGLPESTLVYVWCRHIGATLGASGWGSTIYQTTPTPVVKSVGTPVIVPPTNGAPVTNSYVTLVSSGFSATPTDTHVSSDWQLATDSGFTNIVKTATADTTNKTSWQITGLTGSTTYYARCRYNGAANGTSRWSDGLSFSTSAFIINTTWKYETGVISGISSSLHANDSLSSALGNNGSEVESSYRSGNSWSTVVKTGYGGTLVAASDGRVITSTGGSIWFSPSFGSWVSKEVSSTYVATSRDGSRLYADGAVYNGSTLEQTLSLSTGRGDFNGDGSVYVCASTTTGYTNVYTRSGSTWTLSRTIFTGSAYNYYVTRDGSAFSCILGTSLYIYSASTGGLITSVNGLTGRISRNGSYYVTFSSESNVDTGITGVLRVYTIGGTLVKTCAKSSAVNSTGLGSNVFVSDSGSVLCQGGDGYCYYWA